MLVHVPFFLFLSLLDVAFGYFLSIVHTASILLSLFLVQPFSSSSRLVGSVPVPGAAWGESFKQFKGGHMNAFMRESELSVVHHRDQLGPVVLVMVHERPKTMVDILVHDFCLSVCLRVERCRQFNFNAQDTAYFGLEREDELGAAVRDDRVRESLSALDIL